MMKSVLRNLLLTCGLGASLHGVASAGVLIPETFADGSMFFVDTSIAGDWNGAKNNADLFGLPGSISPAYFAATRTKAESDAVFDLIGQFIGTDATLVDYRFYFGLKYVVGTGWGWLNGDPTYESRGLFVPGTTSPYSAPSYVAFPWGAGYQSNPTDNGVEYDAGAYIACTANTLVPGWACNSSTLEWRYEPSTAPSTAQGFAVLQTSVPLPATLGIVLAGLIGMAGLRRARS
jgi:hypothetical protein